jgi:hypothetical protein
MRPIRMNRLKISFALILNLNAGQDMGNLPNSVRSTIAEEPWRFDPMRMRDLIHDVTAGRSATAGVGSRSCRLHKVTHSRWGFDSRTKLTSSRLGTNHSRLVANGEKK